MFTDTDSHERHEHDHSHDGEHIDVNVDVAHSGHSHGGGDFWSEYFGLLTDPAHLLFEVTFTIVFDLLVVGLLWGVFAKKVIIPRIRKQLHAELDAEHGVVHDPVTGEVTHRHSTPVSREDDAGDK